ncbi:MAG: VanZ family protein [Fidelibacterota bacterium]|nr:MAG: VanZ family protein [Candidatus Neomarinimicrobiota bacterium]
MMKNSALWAILYALVIIGLSSIPGKSFPSVKWLSHDKLIHLCEYTIFGFLVSRAILARVLTTSHLALFTFFLAGTFAALDESYQFLIPGRDPSFQDWVADAVGVVIGSLIFITWKRRRAHASTG